MALYKLSYGLHVLTARDGETDNGCIINTAQQAGSDPLSLSIAVNKENLTHDMILSSHKFNVSIISEAASFELFRRFGFQSGRDADKFAGYDAVKKSGNGLYYITEGTNGFFRRGELIAIRDKFGDERKTEIQDIEDEIDIEDLIEEEESVITLTHCGYIKRIPASTYQSQHRGGKGIKGMQTIEDDFIEDLLMTTNHHIILMFTNKGRVYKLKAYETYPNDPCRFTGSDSVHVSTRDQDLQRSRAASSFHNRNQRVRL